MIKISEAKDNAAHRAIITESFENTKKVVEDQNKELVE